MPRSITHVKRVKHVFAFSTDEEKAMQVQIARMCVLYEDFMIEFRGAQEEAMPALDITSVETRRFYFMRRIIATMMEFSGAVQALNKSKMFQTRLKWLPAANVKVWEAALEFFSDQDNHAFLKDWRNDLGGHFLDRAAEFAITEVHPTTLSTIEIHRVGNGANVKMKLAYELVAVALTRIKKPTETDEEFLKRAFTFLLETHKQTIQVMGVIAVDFLLTG